MPYTTNHQGATLAGDWQAVTPSDSASNNLNPGPCSGLYIGGAGNIALVSVNGNVVTFIGVTAGSFLPLRAVRVNATNTTATSIVACY